MKFILTIMITFVLHTENVQAQAYDPTDDLFFAFGSKCKGKGPINSAALKDTGSLKSIIEGIRDDNTCKGISGALSDIENLNVPNLLKDRQAQDDLEYMSMQANDLDLAIKTESAMPTPDVDYLTALKTELVSTKVSIAKSKKLSNQENTRKRLETIDNYQKYSSSLFAKLKTSDQCLTKNPNLSAQIGAQVLGLGSTLANGLVGSLMLSAGNMIDNFISFYRERNLGNKIKNITNVRMGEAIGCSFEGLAFNYCQARDIDTVINFNKNKSENRPITQNWLEGIDVMGQDVQAYMDWITHVNAGTPAGSTGIAADKKAALSLQNDIRATQIDLDGILNTAKQTVAQSVDKKAATFKALNDMAAKLTPKNMCDQNGCTQSGPFLTIFTSDPNCGPSIYLYSGGKDYVRDDAGTVPCSTYVAKKYPNPPNINSEVGASIDSLIAQANSIANIQLSQVNESNPNLVLSKVDARSQNRRSAREFLNGTAAYLDNLLKDSSSIANKKTQRDLIEKTKGQIENSLAILERAEEPVDPANPTGPQRPADPQKKVLDLSSELIPKNDTFAIPNALSEIVNQDIDQRISLGKIDENLAVLMQLSSNDSLGELIKFYIGLESAKTQSRSAKELTKSNLTALAEVFSENLEGRMEKLSKDAKSDPDANESLGLLCMQSLAVPDSPKVGEFDAGKYCSGKTYESIYDKSGIKMNYDELSKKSYPEKACAVYDFYRKSYLYGLKTKRGTTDFKKSAPGIK